MRLNRLTLGASLLGAAAALAQTPPGMPPAQTMPPPQQMPPPRPLPPELLRGGLTPGGKLPDRSQSQTTPPDGAPEPGLQRFNLGDMRLRLEAGNWQLWAGPQLLKDFGKSEADARE